MTEFWSDLRVAARSLLKSRAFTTVTVLTLAVAIGATTAIYTVVESVLFRALPYPDTDRIVRVAPTVIPSAAGATPDMPFSDRGYWHFVEKNQAFEAFGGYFLQVTQVPLTGDGPPIQVAASRLTRSAFDILGVSPERGRLPTAEEDAPDAPWVVLISHGLWADRYGSDPSMLGRTIDLNGTSMEVIGIMPPDFDFPQPEVDVWLPYRLDPASPNFGGHHIAGIARLAPGATIESAVSDAEGLVARFAEAGYGPNWFSGVFDGHAHVWTLTDEIVGDARRPLLILFGAVAFVLLIACSNVANLLLVRAETRTRESAVRLALGSGRGRLIRRVLTESLLLSVVGGALGTLLAWWGVRALVVAAPASIPRLDEIAVRGSVLALAAGVSVAVGFVFGLIPALRAGSRRSLAALKDGGRGATIGRDRHRARSLLVVSQVALALVLLVGSGLMVRTFQKLRAVDPGFDAARVLTFGVRPLPTKYQGAEAVSRFYEEMRGRLASLQGVEAAGGINTLPLTGGGARLTTIIDEFPPAEDEFPPVFLIRRVTPGYFEAMGVPVVEGRAFTADDNELRLGSLVISSSVKRQYWPETSALGKRIQVAGIPARVVGVVSDVHDTSLDTPAEQFMYLPVLDSVGGGVGPMTMAVRTDRDPVTLVPAVREALSAMDPDLAISEVRGMDAVVGDSLSRTTFTMTLLLVGALVGLFLGCVGVYGVVSYIVSQRTAEIGVRLALGAEPATVQRMVLGQGLQMALVGVVVGLLASFGLGKVLESLLFDVSPLDPLTLVAGSLAFLVAAALATLVPAARAARTPPDVALRAM